VLNEMQRSRTSRIPDNHARKEVILENARAVFDEYGFADARIAEIGRRAGISEATVYTYFSTKTVLMQAVLSKFWDDLSAGARKTVEVFIEPLDQLRALAAYHLSSFLENIAFLDLDAKLRKAHDLDAEVLARFRIYVQVFDKAFDDGMAQGLFDPNTNVWIARDMFYGTLEYSARTIHLRQTRELAEVVDNLMRAFVLTYGPHEESTPLRRLENVARRLELAIEQAAPFSKKSIINRGSE